MDRGLPAPAILSHRAASRSSISTRTLQARTTQAVRSRAERAELAPCGPGVPNLRSSPDAYGFDRLNYLALALPHRRHGC
jgi:hypothetical protein